jgi:hypothetical protein
MKAWPKLSRVLRSALEKGWRYTQPDEERIDPLLESVWSVAYCMRRGDFVQAWDEACAMDPSLDPPNEGQLALLQSCSDLVVQNFSYCFGQAPRGVYLKAVRKLEDHGC